MPDRTSTGAMLVQGTAVGAQPQQPQQPMQPMQPMQTQFGAVPGAIPQQVMPMQQQHYGGAQPVQHYGGAQVHQVSTFTPQVAQVTSMKWDGGLCECFDDMEICLIGWLCSCVMYGQTKERAGTGASPDRAAPVFARSAMTELAAPAGDCCCAATAMAIGTHTWFIVSYIAGALTFGLGWIVSTFIFAMIFGCWFGQGRSDIQARLGLVSAARSACADCAATVTVGRCCKQEDEGNNKLCYGLWCFLTCGIVPHLALCQEARAVKQRWLANGQQPLGPPIVPMAPVSAQGYAQPGQYAAMG